MLPKIFARRLGSGRRRRLACLAAAGNSLDRPQRDDRRLWQRLVMTVAAGRPGLPRPRNMILEMLPRLEQPPAATRTESLKDSTCSQKTLDSPSLRRQDCILSEAWRYPGETHVSLGSFCGSRGFVERQVTKTLLRRNEVGGKEGGSAASGVP